VLEVLWWVDCEGWLLAGSRVCFLFDMVVEVVLGLCWELGFVLVDVMSVDLVGEFDGGLMVLWLFVWVCVDDDLIVLVELFSLFCVYFIIDGYNVIKSVYGDLSLVD